MFKRVIRAAFGRLGYEIRSVAAFDPETYRAGFPADFDAEMIETCRQVQPYTMTSRERIFALCQATDYIAAHKIPGDIVECGVWKGGSMMAVARTLLRRGAADRRLYLFDTFEGMSAPGAEDVTFHGQTATRMLQNPDRTTNLDWAYGPLEEVRRNMGETGYDPDRVVFVPGRVEETLPGQVPERIALLRLDTDWYESTYHELVHLYPRLSVGGVLILDDYGHWEGARQAADQYLRETGVRLLLNRIDYTGRIAVKVDA